MDSDKGDGSGSGALEKLSNKLNQFLTEAKRIHAHQYLLSVAQLCHSDTQLANDTWIKLFPKIWSSLSDRQRQVGAVLHTAIVSVESS